MADTFPPGHAHEWLNWYDSLSASEQHQLSLFIDVYEALGMRLSKACHHARIALLILQSSADDSE